MAHDRRAFLKTAGIGVGATALSGCIGGFGGGGGGVNVGMVYALGGLDDDSFNDMAKKGVEDAVEEFDVSYDEVEPQDATEFQGLQQRYARSGDPDYDLICCIGFVQVDALGDVSSNFPDQNFLLVDAAVDADNVANYQFKEHEGSFQVGSLAGQLTTMEYDENGGSTNGDTVVGFVGGEENPLIKKFEAGYRAGVAHADDGIEVQSAYTGSWSDISRAKEIANTMYDNGADVVYHAAGNAGNGVFQAAEEQGRYAIGVDDDQSVSAADYADYIVASMVKRVDTAVYEAIESVVNGEFEGSDNTLDLESGGVEAVIGTEFTDAIPESITSSLDETRQAIIDGDLSVPTEVENV